MNATFTGIHEHDHRLPDWSRGARKGEAAELRAIHADLAAECPLPPGGLGALRHDASALDAELARANLEIRLAEHASGFFHDRNPALWTGEAIFGALSLMIRPFAPRDVRLPSLARRLAAVPAFLGGMRTVIDGPVPPRWSARAQRECMTAVGLFGEGLAAWLATDPSDPTGEGRVLAAAQAARAAFADCAAWLATRPAADETAYAAGPELFGTLLSRGHFCARTPRDLLAAAETAIAEERARLEAMTAGAGGSWADVQEALAADHPTVSDYYAAFQRRWDACRACVITKDAVTWPDWPIRYVPIPTWANGFVGQLYWLFYRSPAPFDPYDVYEYLVAPIDGSLTPDEQERRLRTWNHSTITLNHVVHHGAVGHHVQNWHAYHRSASRVGAIAAVDCASRIGMFLGGSMAEGWACYATGLMEELGLLTPLERLSEQHTRVRMLARAIVDIRIHLGDWPLSSAITFYERTVGMSADAAAGEATRNSMFPGTAVMYWLGTKGILDLRATVRRQAGSTFSLRTFHDELLGRGSVPVPLVAALMTEHVA